ncbi:MAG: methyltransferase domain-containing protein [Nitrospirota bacterium]|nr:MAG: methyltransferase domain-containing protein [Nitrospirota bacterium]
MLKRTRNHYHDVPLRCPVCTAGVNEVRYIYDDGERKSKIFKCNDCGFMFAKPIFIEELEERQMDSVADAEFFHNERLKYLYETIIIGKEIRNVRKAMGPGEFSLLDIGCGTGWSTNVWSRNGFRVTAVEPSEARARIAREKYGIEVYSDYLENIDLPDTYDVVILRQVLEHMEEPGTMIAKAKALLNPGGVLLIIVPNINSIGRYIFGTKWAWVLPYHCNFFTPKTLRKLMTLNGLYTMSCYQTPSPLFYPVSLFRSLPGGEGLIKGFYDKLSTVALLPFVPIVFVGYILNLSENITIIARHKTE